MVAPRRAFMGIDAGTSGCKTVVIDEQGAVRATAWTSYPTRRTLDGEVTQDADDWLRAATRTARECVRAADELEIAGLSVTAPAHNVVLVDERSEPLSRVVLWSDARPEPIGQELAERLGEPFRERTFVRLNGSWSLPQLVWLRRTDPERWQKVRLVLSAKDYLRHRITDGPALTDPSDAAGTALFDPQSASWWDVPLDEARLELEQLPLVKPAASVAAGVGRWFAGRTGLRPGTPVAVGSTDTAAELISVGATAPGMALIKIASTGTVVSVSSAPKTNPALFTYPHAVPDRWYTVAATSTAATAFQWLRETVFSRRHAEPGVGYAEMDASAARIPPGSDGLIFLPFLEGERAPYWDRDLRGAIIGLTSAHRNPHLCRSVLEGVAFSLRACRDLVVAAGIPVESPAFGGGGMASRLWRTILASALDVTGHITDPQGPAVGAALLARAAVDGDLSRLDRHPPRTRQVPPIAEWCAVYDRLYPVYQEAAETLPAVSHRLSREAQLSSLEAKGQGRKG
jgi:xylulokinase